MEGPARLALLEARAAIEAEIRFLPEFLTSLSPLPARCGAPDPVRAMYEAAAAAGVGPMAAVAGAVAEHVGRALLAHSQEVLVENGGDLYVVSETERLAALFAGESPLSMKVAVKIPPGEWGVCTSAGRVGPSLSYGQADAAMVLSKSAALSDAAATALGNLLKSYCDIEAALERVMGIRGVLGAVAVIGSRLGASGMVQLAPYQAD